MRIVSWKRECERWDFRQKLTEDPLPCQNCGLLVFGTDRFKVLPRGQIKHSTKLGCEIAEKSVNELISELSLDPPTTRTPKLPRMTIPVCPPPGRTSILGNPSVRTPRITAIKPPPFTPNPKSLYKGPSAFAKNNCRGNTASKIKKRQKEAEQYFKKYEH